MEPSRGEKIINVSIVKVPPTHAKINFRFIKILTSRYTAIVAPQKSNQVTKEKNPPIINVPKYEGINALISDKGKFRCRQSWQT